jgi:hypothetical protein
MNPFSSGPLDTGAMPQNKYPTAEPLDASDFSGKIRSVRIGQICRRKVDNMRRRFQVRPGVIVISLALLCAAFGSLEFMLVGGRRLDVDSAKIGKRVRVTAILICPFGPPEVDYSLKLEGPTPSEVHSTRYHAGRSWLCVYSVDTKVKLSPKLQPGSYRLQMIPKNVRYATALCHNVELLIPNGALDADSPNSLTVDELIERNVNTIKEAQERLSQRRQRGRKGSGKGDITPALK